MEAHTNARTLSRATQPALKCVIRQLLAVMAGVQKQHHRPDSNREVGAEVSRASRTADKGALAPFELDIYGPYGLEPWESVATRRLLSDESEYESVALGGSPSFSTTSFLTFALLTLTSGTGVSRAGCMLKVLWAVPIFNSIQFCFISLLRNQPANCCSRELKRRPAGDGTLNEDLFTGTTCFQHLAIEASKCRERKRQDLVDGTTLLALSITRTAHTKCTPWVGGKPTNAHFEMTR
ncbi:hypothetical protein C8R45DRAFT_939314 [Mycena sanguinolenta]|nr:hypothetical protein C8R45DRAFT_939314 [Mycena sanguinolenta]